MNVVFSSTAWKLGKMSLKVFGVTSIRSCTVQF